MSNKSIIYTKERAYELDIPEDGVVQFRQGVPVPLSASISEKYLSTALLTKNDDDTLANIAGLAHAVEANKVYRFKARLLINSGTTPDLKVGATLPSGGAIIFKTPGSDNFGTASPIVIAGTGAAQWTEVEGIVTIGATAGTFQLQAAQNTATASDSTVAVGSSLIVERISK